MKTPQSPLKNATWNEEREDDIDSFNFDHVSMSTISERSFFCFSESFPDLENMLRYDILREKFKCSVSLIKGKSSKE